jgi:ParB family chromosome partitioning protein
MLLLRDAEWSKRSNRWIADKCGVSDPFVMSQREPLTVSSSPTSRAGRDGKVRRLPAKAAAKPTSDRAAAQPATAVAATLAKVIEQLAEQDENEVRKEFTPSERVSIVEAIRAHIGNRAGRPGKNIPEKSPEFPVGVETREYAAAKGGFGNDFTYRQAKSVVDRGTPELARAMDSGALSINMASKLAERPHADQQRIATAVLSGEDARNALRELHRDERVARLAEIVKGNTALDGGVGQHAAIGASPHGHGHERTRICNSSEFDV